VISALASWLLAAITEAGKLAAVAIEMALTAGVVISMLVDPNEGGTSVQDFNSWSSNYVARTVLP
jgi:hypothetical protein